MNALHWHPRLCSQHRFSGFLRARRKNFFGRTWPFEEIERRRTRRAEKAMPIVGEPGIGKSAIVAELLHRNPSGQVLARHCCRSDESSSLQPALEMRALAAQIAAALPR